MTGDFVSEAAVVVLALHQREGLGDVLVVEGQGLVGGDVDAVGAGQRELDDADKAVVDECDKLAPHAVAHVVFAGGLNGADALGLDKQLVGDGLGAHDAPRSAIVLELGGEHLAANGQCLLKLAVGP